MNEFTTLAASAASTLVGLMATDAWNQAKVALSRVFARTHGTTDDIAGELEASHSELIAAQESGDDSAYHELVQEWKGRIRRRLVAEPDLVTPLATVLNELTPLLPNPDVNAERIDMKAVASGHGTIYQQGQGNQINR